MEVNLLEQIIAKLDRGSTPDRKWPDRKGEYWPLCPFHNDGKPGSFKVGEKGFKCFSCGRGGSLDELAKELGIIVPSGKAPLKTIDEITLKSYAEAKHLDPVFLETLGIYDRSYRGRNRLRIPYFDENRQERAVRCRLSLGGNDRFRWSKDSKIIPYGLWKLDELLQCCSVVGGVKPYIILVEGESDAQTLWHYNIPALGIPGANAWKKEWTDFVRDLDVYVWQEPDDGGKAFVETIGKFIPNAQIIIPPSGRKDVSDCHINGDDVPALVQRLMSTSKSFEEIVSEQSSAVAEEAYQIAERLLHASIWEEYESQIKSLGLVGEAQATKILFLAVVSRLLERPISVVVKGPSSGGKSFTVETVLKFFPGESYYALSSMSERALAYSEEPLKHRMLVIYEATGMNSEFATYLMRSLLSEGKIRYETVEKTNDGLKSRLIEREGPTGLLVTTTATKLHPENETRMISITVKDDPFQTKNILSVLAEQANGKLLADPDLSEWHAMQTWLDLKGDRSVTIPYAELLAENTPPAAVRMRRDFGVVLNLICAHTILYQCQRQRDNIGRIIATLDDYRIVYHLIIDLISEGVGSSVSPTVRETVRAVEELINKGGHKTISIALLSNTMGLDKSTVSRRVRQALDLGFLNNEETGKRKSFRLVIGDPLPQDEPVLPPPEVLEKILASIPPNNTATVQHSILPGSESDEAIESEVGSPLVENEYDLKRCPKCPNRGKGPLFEIGGEYVLCDVSCPE